MPPLTLGDALAAHLRLIVWCKACGHQSEPDVAAHGGALLREEEAAPSSGTRRARQRGGYGTALDREGAGGSIGRAAGTDQRARSVAAGAGTINRAGRGARWSRSSRLIDVPHPVAPTGRGSSPKQCPRDRQKADSGAQQ
jgi:hypothetical protein